jgi:hypothetical protein
MVAGEPAPGGRLRDRQQHQHETGAEDQRSPPVDPAGGGRWPVRQDAPGEAECDQGETETDPERRAVVGAVAAQQTCGDQTDDAAHGEHAADDGDRDGEAVVRQLAPEHGDRQGEQPVGGALHHPGHQQQRIRGGDDGQQGAGAHGEENSEDHRPLAPEIAQPTQHRGQDRCGEQVGREHPAGGGRRDTELLSDRAQNRHDEALRQRQRRHAEREREDQQRRSRTRAVGHRPIRPQASDVALAE